MTAHTLDFFGSESQSVQYARSYGSVDQFAHQLTTGFSRYVGEPVDASFKLRPGRVMTYNHDKLSKAGKWFAHKSLQAWSAATGIKFKKVPFAKADIKYVQGDQDGAYTVTNYNSKGDITKAKVNIPKWWHKGEAYKLASYSYQTFLHETGHALGLGHAGNYNGNARFPKDAKFANDSWQMSVMSYFSQTENTKVSGSKAFILTPMPADLEAIHDLYGRPSGSKKVNTGSTTYGFGSKAKGPVKHLTKQKSVGAFTIFDQGGTDAINMSKTSKSQRIDLNPGSFSNVLGKSKNLQIEKGTWIENAIGGQGADVLIGNKLVNKLIGYSGADILVGNGGNDRLYGNDGKDKLIGGLGNDLLRGGKGADVLNGGSGFDSVSYRYEATGVDVNLTTGQSGRGASGDTFLSIEGVEGSVHADNLIGNAAANWVSGRSGDDVLQGMGGADRLYGGAGNDVLAGGAGDDLLHGGSGADEFIFESGNDVIADFSDIGGDSISIDADLVVVTDAADLIANSAQSDGTDTTITFDNGDTLIVRGVADPSSLVDDIAFF